MKNVNPPTPGGREWPIRDVAVTITVSEKDRKLNIVAKVPDGAEGSIALLVAEEMIKVANVMLNEVLGQDERIQTVREQ